MLEPKVQKFINDNIGADISKMALQKNPFPEIEWIAILNQIVAKTKSKEKLPTWFSSQNIQYPAKISIEQTSSEKTALYKSELVSGKNLIDLTGGFGVDDFYFAKRMERVVHCEINLELSEIVKDNFGILHVGNIHCFHGDSTEILHKLNQNFDWIYIDPSRRNDAKGKVFLLKDCSPNVPDLLEYYFKFSNNILIKTAPILDISAGLSELSNVKKIHIVAVDGEVKELLWEIEKDYSDKIEINAANLLKEHTEDFKFDYPDILLADCSLPEKYLYEPNAAIMKSGGFNAVAIRYKLKKLHPHSHLYTSDQLVSFPGRIFKILQNIPYNKASMKTYLENKQANVTIRNFPDSVENIRAKWKIKDGGTDYCFFTTDLNDKKIVLICSKIK